MKPPTKVPPPRPASSDCGTDAEHGNLSPGAACLKSFERQGREMAEKTVSQSLAPLPVQAYHSSADWDIEHRQIISTTNLPHANDYHRSESVNFQSIVLRMLACRRNLEPSGSDAGKPGGWRSRHHHRVRSWLYALR